MSKTMVQAVKAFRATTVKGTACVAYQFPKGHWGAATVDSEVGQRIAANGDIYQGVKATQAQQFTA